MADEIEKASRVAYEALDEARRAHARLDVIDEQYKVNEKWKADSRTWLVEIRTSYTENFNAFSDKLERTIGHVKETLVELQLAHEAKDDERFGVISRRMWAAAIGLIGTMFFVVVGLIAVIWAIVAHKIGA